MRNRLLIFPVSGVESIDVLFEVKTDSCGYFPDDCSEYQAA